MSENQYSKQLQYLDAWLETFGENFTIYADYASRLSRHRTSFTVLLKDMDEVAALNKKNDEAGLGSTYWVALGEYGDQITNPYELEDLLTSQSQQFIRLVKPFPVPEKGKFFITKEHLNISKIDGFSWHGAE